MEKSEMLAELKKRLDFLPEEKLKALLKKTKEPTETEIQEDIVRLSPRIRQNNKY